MKKVLFLSAVMCMAMAAFVACNKNNDNDPEAEGEGGGNGKCTCYFNGTKLGEYDMEGYASCSQLNAIVGAAYEGTGYTVNCK